MLPVAPLGFSFRYAPIFGPCLAAMSRFSVHRFRWLLLAHESLAAQSSLMRPHRLPRPLAVAMTVDSDDALQSVLVSLIHTVADILVRRWLRSTSPCTIPFGRRRGAEELGIGHGFGPIDQRRYSQSVV